MQITRNKNNDDKITLNMVMG